MQTNFTPEQLKDSATAVSEQILRKCVHCGFCTATCPTFALLGDELDSPRGRIYLIKEMLENNRPADAKTVKHIDRCLSCLSCMTTCPSGVNYMHLVDHARIHIERTYKRPLQDRMLRAVLQAILPKPGRFRLAIAAAFYGRPFAGLMKKCGGTLAKLGTLLALAPTKSAMPSQFAGQETVAPKVQKKGRVAILKGCAQSVLAPSINDAATRLLTRIGYEVVFPKGEGCCGALVHHMGKEEASNEQAKTNIDAWMREMEGEGLDAVIITASGCGTTIKDYGFMLRDDPQYAAKAQQISQMSKDIVEFLIEQDLGEAQPHEKLTIAYHSACSMQHGQKITWQPKKLLQNAGFTVKEPLEGHLCCGSAGTYNIMQPKIATALRDRKVSNLEATQPDLVATGNIGCITQISSGTQIPVIHSIELLDWAYGGPKPMLLDKA
ncbi:MULTISPECIES: glycolate oxidase subunit GlcF [unclassified Pseudovibrio]|uniref:glycolate oxidase subunit GlcF n=1 Tax=unclassified Pseudovibrio TaxID=2627060 RepID=UPI0007AE95FF|nr:MULTISPECIES: glycolate oxidase subunit GlcF [unclassified Pseudovibrio]KZK94264.1 Lactate utilization protein A [Pseudovibrio sp. W74]KZL09920.1 Lactate utilization protein A [Pseudovibrio sp. Ad14]